jgi:hypothetical protein
MGKETPFSEKEGCVKIGRGCIIVEECAQETRDSLVLSFQVQRRRENGTSDTRL